jgi:glycopeptide antibiotics resistance protein
MKIETIILGLIDTIFYIGCAFVGCALYYLFKQKREEKIKKIQKDKRINIMNFGKLIGFLEIILGFFVLLFSNFFLLIMGIILYFLSCFIEIISNCKSGVIGFPRGFFETI